MPYINSEPEAIARECHITGLVRQKQAAKNLSFQSKWKASMISYGCSLYMESLLKTKSASHKETLSTSQKIFRSPMASVQHIKFPPQKKVNVSVILLNFNGPLGALYGHSRLISGWMLIEMTSSSPKYISAYHNFLLHHSGLVKRSRGKMGVQSMMPSNNKKNEGTQTGLTLLTFEDYEYLADL